MKKEFVKLDKLDLLQDKAFIPIKKSELKRHTQNNNHIYKWHKKKYMSNKLKHNEKKLFIKNKRKDKKRIRQEMPDSPHNTGQYLSHIHQELNKKNKSTSLSKDNDELIGNEIINDFEEEDNSDDFQNLNLDFPFFEDRKRDQLMSMEGEDIQNFLFNHKEKEKEKEEIGNNHNINNNKSGISFCEIKEDNSLNLKCAK